jgi:amino acid transporter
MEKNNKQDGLGLLSVIWIGFNFIAGITFACAFSSLVWNGEKGLGLNILWVDIIEGVIAFVCAWSFAKLVSYHPMANGGLSQYARTSFGKYWGLIGGLLNYMSLPLIASTMFVSTIRTNFGPGSAVNLLEKWGSFSSLYLDLMGFVVFILAAGVVFLGTRKYKYFTNIIGILTWVLTLFVIVFAIGAFAMNGTKSLSFLAKAAPISNVDGKSFATTFMSIFFSFAGIETFITSGQTIKDRARNMPIGIVVIMILVTLFYIVFTFLVIGAVDIEGNGFGGNPSITLFQTWDQHFDTGSTFKNIGAWVIIAATLLMRFGSLINITMFGGLTLEPLARQGYVTSGVATPSAKTGLPVKAILITIGIFAITAALFLFLPDIVQGITNSPSPFDYSSLAGVASIVMIGIYTLSIVTCLVQGFKKNIKLHIIEYIGFFATLAFIGFLLVMYFWTSIIDGYTAGGTQGIVAATIQLLYICSIFAVGCGLYFGYHKKFLRQIENDAAAKKELIEYEKVFTIITPEQTGLFNKTEKEQKEIT